MSWNPEGRRGSNSLHSCFPGLEPESFRHPSHHLQGLPSAGQGEHVEKAVSKVAFPPLSWLGCRQPLGPPTFVSTCCSNLVVERPEVAAENDTPLRPRHSFRLAVWAERRRLADRFRVNEALHTRNPLSDGGLCTHCLLSCLCCLSAESLLNQDFFRLRLSSRAAKRASMDETLAP